MYFYTVYCHSRQSGWLGFGQTTISQGKTKLHLTKKQEINKSTKVNFGLIRVVILQYSR